VNQVLADTLLDVRNLHVRFNTPEGVLDAVRDLSYTIARGEALGLVGESGTGKSVGALTLLGLLPPNAQVVSGSARFDNEELIGRDEIEMRSIRGKRIGIVFQDPLSSLNPVLRIGHQITEALQKHLHLSQSAARRRAVELLHMVGIADPSRRFEDYPHQLSGGMQQRVMIAIALSCEPTLLIADEPTTALDVTTQAQILDLLRKLRADLRMSVLLITHNLGVVAGLTDRIAIMYAGRIVEAGPTAQVLQSPRHPYTIGLLRSIARLDRNRNAKLVAIEGAPPRLDRPLEGCPFTPRCAYAVERCAVDDPPLAEVEDKQATACWVNPRMDIRAATEATRANGRKSKDEKPFLEVDNLRVWFPISGLLGRRTGWIRAVDGVSLEIKKGETLGLVGESGCGKTTVARTIVRIEDPVSGTVRLDGENLVGIHGRELRRQRRRFQMIFQNPYSSLNPRQTVSEIVAEPLVVHGIGNAASQRKEVGRLLELVGLDNVYARRYPREFSGGQRQRIGIARALATQPSLLVCDEPISALDVSIQAQVVNLLKRLQEELGLTYLFVAHDLAVVRHIADRVAVMYLGGIVEEASSDELYANPLHPYTISLISAVPVPDAAVERSRKRIILVGDVPSAANPPTGCRFHPRCWLREALGRPERCTTQIPDLQTRIGSASLHSAACHFIDEVGRHKPSGVTSLTA
jgi:peptide/nickel transport system ATP-binding protein